MLNTDHLTALHTRLCNEKERLNHAKPREKKLRNEWILQIEREIADEMNRLGMTPSVSIMDDDEILKELEVRL